MISLLRIYLLLGLIVHKAVWEILKRRPQGTSTTTDNNAIRPVRTGDQRSVPVQFVKAVKIALLVGIAVQCLLPEVLPIASEPLMIRTVGVVVYTIGLLIAIRGRLELGMNWSDIETAKVLREQRVVANGLYRFIRHPIYVGDLLLLLGLELSLNSWLVLGVLLLAPVVLMQAVREEKKLTQALPGYQDYCAQTKRFIPFVV